MGQDWPDWPFYRDDAMTDPVHRDHVADLARYVDQTRALGLIPAGSHSSWSGPEAGAARVRQLYDSLRDRRIVYANEAWNPNSLDSGELVYQRVRGPAETIQGPATCLDLALLFAGFALAADLRPYIGLRVLPMQHALVVIDLRQPLSDGRGERGAAAPPGFAADQDIADIYRLAPAGSPATWATRQPEWLVVDVARAARSARLGVLEPAGDEFDAAVAAGIRALRDGQRHSHHKWIMVDVDRIRAARPPYPPPAGRSVPAIHGYLPALPAFTGYPTRKPLLDSLYRDAAGPRPVTVVLHGESGLGKSMLAHRVALAADHGCGWFLNATDPTALTRALAQAERQEQSLRDEQANPAAGTEKADAGEDKAFAAAALDRLRGTDQPWVVVLDNCDSAPDTPELQELIPQPARPGQVVIITTTDPDWASLAANRGWVEREVPKLEQVDLRPLGLPDWAESAAAGKPLVAQALAALRPDAGQRRESVDGPGLVWDLLRDEPSMPPESIDIARLLAWCPPEAVDVASLLEMAGAATASGAEKPLADLRFVTSTLPDPPVAVSEQGALSTPVAAGPAIQMHRLFAAAVREQTWTADQNLAAAMIERLLTNERGRRVFIDAADSTALERMEGIPGEVTRAAVALSDDHRAGLLWHGLGHIRERRGPVGLSDEHFERALARLDRGSAPFEVAECLIGRARLVFQRKRDPAELVRARQQTEDGQQLLANLAKPEARQMREQGNALFWLIEQVIAGQEKDLHAREELLLRVREELWRSYEKRLALVRDGKPPPSAADRLAGPVAGDGLGAERAYYNLAGVNIQLAKTHRTLAGPKDDLSACRPELLQEVQADLDEAARVYAVTRALREQRYGGRPHPHLASCVHGQALVAYFRASLLRDTGQLADVFGFEGVAMEQRLRVAGSLTGLDNEAVFRDTDVSKSVDFWIKMFVPGVAARYADPGKALAKVTEIFGAAVDEWFGVQPPAAG